MVDREPLAVIVATLAGVMLACVPGCSRDAIVRRRDGAYVRGRVVAVDNGHIELTEYEQRTHRVAQREVEDVQHPGLGLFLAGVSVGALGALALAEGSSDNIIGWGGMLAITGFGLSLASRAPFLGESGPDEIPLRRQPRNKTPGFVVGGLFLPSANGPMLAYELRHPGGSWALRPYVAGLSASGQRGRAKVTAFAVAAGVGASFGRRFRVVTDVGINNGRQVVFPLLDGVGARRGAWQATGGLGVEIVLPAGWFARATIGATYRFDVAPAEDLDPLAFTVTPCSFGVRL